MSDIKVQSITPNPPADFTPSMGDYQTLQPFRYWCQKVLPLVYDDSLSYYELLCKVVDYLNKTMQDVETLHGDVTNLHTAYEQLQSYVNNYFSTLDVQEEINKKLDEMSKNGELLELFQKFFSFYVTPQIYGAKGDGVNDDTEYIKQALNSGLVVVLPIGTYLISETIEVTSDKTILGCGSENTIITSNGSCPVLNVTGTNNTLKNFKVSGRTNRSILSKPKYGINVNYTGSDGADSSNKFININIYFFETGIEISNSSRSCVFNNIKISWCYTKGINCVGTDNIFDNIICSFCVNGITLYNNNILSNSKCFQISGTALSLTGNRCMISNFDLQEFYVGLYIVGSNSIIKGLSISHSGYYYNFETSKTVTDHSGALISNDGTYNIIEFSYDSNSNYYVNNLIISNPSNANYNNINCTIKDTLATNIYYAPNNSSWIYYNKLNVNGKYLPEYTVIGMASDIGDEIIVPYVMGNVWLRYNHNMPNTENIYVFEKIRTNTSYRTMNSVRESETQQSFIKVNVNDNKVSILTKSNELSSISIIVGMN